MMDPEARARAFAVSQLPDDGERAYSPVSKRSSTSVCFAGLQTHYHPVRFRRCLGTSVPLNRLNKRRCSVKKLHNSPYLVVALASAELWQAVAQQSSKARRRPRRARARREDRQAAFGSDGRYRRWEDRERRRVHGREGARRCRSHRSAQRNHPSRIDRRPYASDDGSQVRL